MLVATLASQASESVVPLLSATVQPSGLKIIVIAGEDAVNIIQQKTAVAPIVEVRDRNDQPVAGAIVTFSIQGARNATFGGGANVLSLTTNAAGRAAAAGLTPTASGAVQIQVAAAIQGQTATATIVQTNVVTAAQAASAAASASGGSAGAGGSSSGGGLGAGTITAIGAGVAGAAGGFYALKKQDPVHQPLTIAEVHADPAVAMQATHVFFMAGISSSDATEPILTWDFGDGTTATVRPGERIPSHVYLTAGTFTARVVANSSNGESAQSQVSVTIKSMTGRWTFDNGFGSINFGQSGASVTGTFAGPSGQSAGAVSGTVGPGVVPGFENFAPGVEFIITPTGIGSPSRFVGSVVNDGTANLVRGGLVTGASTTVTQLIRQ